MGSLLQNTIFGKKYKLLNNLVAYYKFNENVAESTGLSPSGTATNTNYVTGKIGSAINFPLSNVAYVDIPNTANLSFTAGNGADIPFSISFWFYTSNFSTTGNWIINKRNNSTDVEWQIHLTPYGAATLTKFSGGSNAVYQSAITSNGIIALNNWYHIVVTDNGSKIVSGTKIYINSISQTINDTSIGQYLGMNIGNSITRIGAANWTLASTLRHVGYVEELGIWKNRVLNQNDVNKLYNSGNGISFPF
ncbi:MULTISPECIES: LamG domain-containing protein [Flavobacterium]|uniref:LamG domain-containing protein n=1 Tax=Flavobacterium TaxID=237 RepID=UPI0021159670|nr:MULTISPECIES: LamG domain-containing protein [Flavobacterium]UUF16646.1 LamG domain-containing protein [Flavobacterium panici]